MATVSASLRMFDMMTRPLQQVTNALNLTISAMDNMNNSANRDIRLTNTLNTARESINRASAGLQELAREQDRARNTQDNLNNSFNRGIDSSGGLTSKIKGLVGAYLGFQTVKKGIDLTIGGAANLERQLITISGMLGNKDVGGAFFEKINDYALISQYGLKDFAAISRQFIQFTKNTDKLMDLNKLAERLAFLDPTQGLEGAGFALKEILGGDGMSLKGRFGFGSGEIKALKEASGMDDFMKKFDQMLNKKGGTQLAVEEAAGAAISLWDNLIANIQTSFSKAGNNALEAIKPLLKTLNEGFKEGDFQPFFDGITIGLTTIVNVGVGLVDVFKKIGQTVSNNWGIIEPMIWGIVAALIVYNATMGIAWLTTLKNVFMKGAHAIASWAETAAIIAMTLAQQGLNAALAMCPLTWIIMGVIILITLFYATVGAVNHFAGTSVSATGIIVGTIAVAGTIIWNIITGVINAIIQAVWTTFAEPFIGIIEWVLNAANGGFNSFGGAVANLIGQITSWFLSLEKVVTKIIDAIFGTDWSGGLSSLQDSVLSWGKNDKAITIDRKAPTIDARIGYSNAWDAGYGFGENIANKFNLGNMFNKNQIPETPKVPNLDAWNKAQGPGTLSTMDPDSKKHLKNIDNKIDVSNEHLKMLRDVADRDYIAKYNTTTLAPNVKVEFGDVKETADANKIAGIITKIIKEEIAALPEGV